MTQISEHLAYVAERIEEDGFEADDALDINYKVESSGDVSEVYAVLTVGGPYVEARLLGGTLYGSWGSDTHTTHVDHDDLEIVGEMLARQMEARID